MGHETYFESIELEKSFCARNGPDTTLTEHYVIKFELNLTILFLN